MKKSILVPGVLLLLLLTTSCRKKITGEGPSVTQTRTVTNFTSVSLSLPALMYVTQEQDYKFTIEAQQNILDIIQTSVTAGDLRIKFDNGKNIGSHDKIIIRVSAPVFNGLVISGTGEISGTNALQTSSLRLALSGSGSIILPQADVAGKLDAYISGSGNIQVSNGVAVAGSLNISGSGSLEMLGVTFKNVDARISGSGNIKATITGELDAYISGSGSVYYKGTPAINSQISGSGAVRKAP